MEFEDLSEGMLLEINRVAGAFGVAEWTWDRWTNSWWVQGMASNGLLIQWEYKDDRPYNRIWINERIQLAFEEIPGFTPGWELYADDDFVPTLAQALYCLGFVFSDVWEELQLSHHQKLELRLGMPREFWPQTWLDEEAADF